MAKVIISKGGCPYKNTLDVLEYLSKDIKKSLKKKKPKTILIKPNLLSEKENKAANTDVRAVMAVVDFFNILGNFDFIVAENTTGGATRAFRNNHYYAKLEKYENVKLHSMRWDKFGKYFQIKTAYRKIKVGICETATKAKYIIDIAKIKSHNHAVATFTIKNMMGFCKRSARSKFHGTADPYVYHGIMKFLRAHHLFKTGAPLLNYNLIKLYNAIKPDLALIDGEYGMEGEGPGHGDAVKLGIAMGSMDALSIDLVAAKIMKLPKLPGYLQILKERESPNIKVIGVQVQEVARKFRLHHDYQDMDFPIILLKKLLRDR